MKYLLIILLVFTSCTHNDIYNDNFELCCMQSEVKTEDPIQNGDSTLTRGWNDKLTNIYLISNYGSKTNNILDIPVKYSGSCYYIDVCFAHERGEIYAISNNKRIKVGNHRNCIFTSSSNEIVKLLKSDVVTPNNRITYEPYGDRLFSSDNITFTYNNGKIYLNCNSSKQNILNHPEINLNRKTFIFKPNIIITDLSSVFIYKMSLDDFEDEMGDINNWKIRCFLNDYPIYFNIFNFAYKDNSILCLYENKEYLDYNVEHAAIQLQWGKPVILGKFIGVGKKDNSNSYIYPININGKELCFSFYYTGKDKFRQYSTLKIPLNDLQIESNIIQNVTVIIDIEDFYEAMKNKNSRSIIDIPYKIYYNKLP